MGPVDTPIGTTEVSKKREGYPTPNIRPCPFCGGEAGLICWAGGGYKVIFKHEEPCFLEGDCTGVYGRATDAIESANWRKVP